MTFEDITRGAAKDLLNGEKIVENRKSQEREAFAKEIDAWDGIVRKPFSVGHTSEPLIVIPLKNSPESTSNSFEGLVAKRLGALQILKILNLIFIF